MAIFKCEYCGKEFHARPSAKRKYCCRECMYNAQKEQKRVYKPRVEKVKVVCAECGKEEYVNPSRAEHYLCCSVECLGKYNSKRYSQSKLHVCPICGKEFKLKPYREIHLKTEACCSVECAAKLKETTFLGENNHQFGLKGELNASFKGEKTRKKNIHYEDIWVYKPERPDINKDKRITEHRLTVLENYTKFDPCFFVDDSGFKVFNPDRKLKICVHHINGNHSDNSLENLVPLTNAAHRKAHSNCETLALEKLNELIGVFKQGELLEKPKEVNQQPSLNSNVLEGSETNSRVLNEDGNADTSALLGKIKNIVDDYIVQTKNIALESYELSIQEILESEIKSSEINT